MIRLARDPTQGGTQARISRVRHVRPFAACTPPSAHGALAGCAHRVRSQCAHSVLPNKSLMDQAGPGGPGAALLRARSCRSAHGPARPGGAVSMDQQVTTEGHEPGSATRESFLVLAKRHRPHRPHQPRCAPRHRPRPRPSQQLSPRDRRRPGPASRCSRIDPAGTVHAAARTTRKGTERWMAPVGVRNGV
jgi:hypothetical protein